MEATRLVKTRELAAERTRLMCHAAVRDKHWGLLAWTCWPEWNLVRNNVSLTACPRGADMVVAAAGEEVNIVRGMALDAIFELQISQANLSRACKIMHAISPLYDTVQHPVRPEAGPRHRLHCCEARRALDGVLNDSKILQHLSEVQLQVLRALVRPRPLCFELTVVRLPAKQAIFDQMDVASWLQKIINRTALGCKRVCCRGWRWAASA